MGIAPNFFLVFLTMSIGVMNILAEAIEYFHWQAHAGEISIITSVALLILPLIGMKIFNLKLKDFHITWLRLPFRTTLETIALLFIPLSLLFVFWHESRTFTQHLAFLQGYFTATGLIGYIISACIQEYVFRGIFLDILIRAGLAHLSLHLVVIFSSILFSVTHEVWGFPAMVFTLFGNIVLSYIYTHQKCLFGVCVLHSCYGVVLFPLIVRP